VLATLAAFAMLATFAMFAVLLCLGLFAMFALFAFASGNYISCCFYMYMQVIIPRGSKYTFNVCFIGLFKVFVKTHVLING